MSGGFGLQLRTTLTKREVAGVSTVWWWMCVANGGLWLSYGLHNNQPQQLLSTLPPILSTIAIGWFACRIAGAVTPVIAATLACFLGLAYPSWPGWLGAPIGMFLALPQLIKTIKTGSTDGVSLAAWLSVAVSGAVAYFRARCPIRSRYCGGVHTAYSKHGHRFSRQTCKKAVLENNKQHSTSKF